MKVFLSCDIEGTSGICTWAETDKPKEDYAAFADRMTEEVAAACHGINSVDPDAEIVVKDAHETATNLDHNRLPPNASLIRGWGCSPYLMMFGIDGSFDASMFTGYHSGGGYNGNPLAHTMSISRLFHVKINGMLASEFLINYYASLYNGVPVALVTGDRQLCEFVKGIDPRIETVDTQYGVGGSVRSAHPAVTRERIAEAAGRALKNRDGLSRELPKEFTAEICYRSHLNASRAFHYPGAYQVDPHTVGYKTEDYYEFLRFFFFTY